jgi:hypothetical protein
MGARSEAHVRHLDRSGQAEHRAHQAFAPGTSREVLPRTLRRVALARLVLFRNEMTRVRTPGVRIIARAAKWFQPGLALAKHHIIAAPQDQGKRI